MTEPDVAMALHDTLIAVLKLGGPALLTLLLVGLVVSLLQAVTQINEATLAFVPKLLALGGVLAITGPFMVTTLQDFTRLLMDRLVAVGGG